MKIYLLNINGVLNVLLKVKNSSIPEVLRRIFHFCFSFFSIGVFFHDHSRTTGLQGKGEGIYVTPHYHFHPLQKHLDISQAITAESSSLHIGSSWTRTGNCWFPVFWFPLVYFTWLLFKKQSMKLEISLRRPRLRANVRQWHRSYCVFLFIQRSLKKKLINLENVANFFLENFRIQCFGSLVN